MHLEQYRRDDASETVRSEGEVSPEKSTEEYFGEEDLDAEEWERVEHDGESLLCRAREHSDVAAVSVPREQNEDDDPDLPGQTVQLRTGGGETYYVTQAKIIEVQDSDP